MSERQLLPVISAEAPTENLCRQCNGACCQAGTILELSDAEREFMEAGGTQLGETGLFTKSQQQVRLDEIARRYSSVVAVTIATAPENPRYALLQNCGYLDSTDAGMAKCTVHEDPRRPKICGDFTAGNEVCHTMREARFFKRASE